MRKSICFIYCGGTIAMGKDDKGSLYPKYSMHDIISGSEIGKRNIIIKKIFDEGIDSVEYHKESHLSEMLVAIKQAQRNNQIPAVVFGTDTIEYYSAHIIEKLTAGGVFFISSMLSYEENESHIKNIFDFLDKRISNIVSHGTFKYKTCFILNHNLNQDKFELLEISQKVSIKKIFRNKFGLAEFILVEKSDDFFDLEITGDIAFINYHPDNNFQNLLIKLQKDKKISGVIINGLVSAAAINKNLLFQDNLPIFLKDKIILTNEFSNSKNPANGGIYKISNGLGKFVTFAYNLGWQKLKRLAKKGLVFEKIYDRLS
ncbi:asparaginase domain-containing protein [Flavobacteriaceae bacterium]|nr:asparaginase domain-containing protein [Flavobacteriaceae bacterium]